MVVSNAVSSISDPLSSTAGPMDVVAKPVADIADVAVDNSIAVLPQYHPNALIAQLRAGKHWRVQRILGHIATCISYVVWSERTWVRAVDSRPLVLFLCSNFIPDGLSLSARPRQLQERCAKAIVVPPFWRSCVRASSLVLLERSLRKLRRPR